jgi:hypothetical protein
MVFYFMLILQIVGGLLFILTGYLLIALRNQLVEVENVPPGEGVLHHTKGNPKNFYYIGLVFIIFGVVILVSTLLGFSF